MNQLGVIVAATCVAMNGCDEGRAKSPATADVRHTAPPVKAISLSAEKIDQSLAAAQEYLDSREIDKAIAILATLIDRAPAQVEARELYGQALTVLALEAERRGDSSAAKDFRQRAYAHYQVAVQIEPRSAGLQHSAGLMAMAAGESDTALKHFQSAGKLDPSNAQYALFEAQPLIQAQRYDEARTAIQRALALDPDEAIAHASLAIIAMELGDFEEALRAMAEARRINPIDLGLRAQQAKIHRRKGDPQRALELLVGLSPRERATDAVTTELAASYSTLGEHAKAAAVWLDRYRSNPADPLAWRWSLEASQEYLRAGDRQQAAFWLQQASLSAPAAEELRDLEAALQK